MKKMGNNCNFVYPSTEKIYGVYGTTEKKSAEDIILDELNEIRYRWYPANGKWKPYLMMNELAYWTLYGKNADGTIVTTNLRDVAYRFKVSGVDNNFVHEGCIKPAFGVTSYYGIKFLPDGIYKVEFLDFPSAAIKQFVKPSF